MDVSELIRAMVGPESRPPPGRPAQVVPGEHLRGKILARRPDGTFRIDFGKFQARAKIHALIRVGDTIGVQVVEAGNPVKLRILPRTTPAAGGDGPGQIRLLTGQQTLRLLSDLAKIRPSTPGDLPKAAFMALRQIQDIASPLDPASGSQPHLQHRIRSLVEDTGFLFEKKIETALAKILGASPETSVTNLSRAPHVQTIMDSDLKPALLRLASMPPPVARPRGGTHHALVHGAVRVLAEIDALHRAAADQRQSAPMAPTYGPPQPAGRPAGEILARITRLATAVPPPADRSESDAEQQLRRMLARLLEATRGTEPATRDAAADPRPPLFPVAGRILAGQIRPMAAALARILDEDGPAARKRLAPVRLAAGRILSLLAEASAEPAKMPAPPEEGLLFTVHLPMKDPKDPARLHIFFSGKSKTAAENSFKVSVMLKMQNLGGIRADFHLLGKRLALAFFTEHPEAHALLEQHRHRLEPLLAASFPQLSVTVARDPSRATTFQPESVASATETGIDLRV